jgi:molybdate transport system substrate-binding protein
MKLYRLFCVLVFSLCSFTAHAGETISIAVASNFAAAMNDIAAAFEHETGNKVEMIFGASGKFYAQIKNGAPFQIFFSADAEKPLQLEQDGLTVPNTRFTYAIGTLALWSANPELVDRKGKILKKNSFSKIAIANPKLAPYGAAAMEVLQHLELAETLKAKLVYGENIAQTFQFVESGNAELGFVALSQITEQEKIKTGSAWIVPAELHSPIRQDAVLLQTGKDSKAARDLLEFVRGDKARSIISSYGYQAGVN